MLELQGVELRERLSCHHFDTRRCGSCTWLPTQYGDQLAAKQAHAMALVDRPGVVWLDPVASRASHFRNRAKMVVAGTVDAPTLGILDRDLRGVDLRDCPLHLPVLLDALPVLAAFARRAALAPYDVATRRGELKHVLVTVSPDDELMVRFVSRSQEPVARIRKHLPWLHEQLPWLRVASVNLLPEHKAVLEGERELLLTEADSLAMRVNGLTLHLRAQSFFQTNTEVAAALYREAQAWTADLPVDSVWDLYCGVGGFALHLAAADRDVLGVETSPEAVASARASAAEAGLPRVRFEAGDATELALRAQTAPDLLVVNPPRRGIGAALAGWVQASPVRHVLYSSCNAESLARDLAAMPGLVPRGARVLDMFPNTSHYELLVLLERVAGGGAR